ncbi:Radial spoke head 10-like protein B [Acropora cervicornis]|uniref:Radial spoke head 10-like protein B n=1 Tax=Acropora cervicornis TaxID=6130 RepID=A0AAD9UX83_ACRCE|nr:Radial spoke head 10-like protein B [Acropora cervicornis]
MPEKLSEVLMETTDSQLDDDAVEKAQDQEEKTLPNGQEGESSKVTQPYDAMRNEPHLVNLIVESYLGEKDERGFFHGIGTAYFKGDHVYSGSFVNGLMDGTGLYIWSHGVKYDGDFRKNKIEGRGIYTWSDESTYDGEVLNGLRHGQGTYTCGTIPSSYTGVWKFGKRYGEGILRYDKEGLSYYDGHWVNNRRHGFGMRRYASGNIYKGDWRDNIRHGMGTMHWHDKNERYEGQWENGFQHGQGEHSWYLKRIQGSQYPLRNYYVGEWLNGLRHGHGTFYYATGAKYVGEWMNNMKHGNGKNF